LVLTLTVSLMFAGTGQLMALAATADAQSGSNNNTNTSAASGSTANSTAVGQDTPGAAQTAAEMTEEYTYDRHGAEPSIPEERRDEQGRLYRLKSVSEPEPAADFVSNRTFTYTVTLPITVEEHGAGDAAIRAHFDESYYVEEDGFSGWIPLVSLSSQPVYRSIERQVDRTVVYPGLPSEDVRQLPESAQFAVTSDAYPGATTQATLWRAAVQWEVTALAADERPIQYSATVTYRGLESDLTDDYYEATAVYQGTVQATAEMVTVVATWELVQLVQLTPQPTPAAAPLPVTEPAEVEPDFPWLLLALAAVISMLALALFLLVFFRGNIRLIDTDAAGASRVLLRRRLRLQDGEVRLNIPAEIELFLPGHRNHLLLSNRLANREGVLVVAWGGLQLLRTGLRREVNLTSDLLNEAASGAMDDIRAEGEDHSDE
jgi:hypothetical protein